MDIWRFDICLVRDFLRIGLVGIEPNFFRSLSLFGFSIFASLSLFAFFGVSLFVHFDQFGDAVTLRFSVKNVFGENNCSDLGAILQRAKRFPFNVGAKLVAFFVLSPINLDFHPRDVAPARPIGRRAFARVGGKWKTQRTFTHQVHERKSRMSQVERRAAHQLAEHVLLHYYTSAPVILESFRRQKEGKIIFRRNFKKWHQFNLIIFWRYFEQKR